MSRGRCSRRRRRKAARGPDNGIGRSTPLRKAVGIDSFRILRRHHHGRKSSVAVGKYVGRKVYVEVGDRVRVQSTQVECRDEALAVVLSQVNLRRDSSNIKISKDYEGPGRSVFCV